MEGLPRDIQGEIVSYITDLRAISKLHLVSKGFSSLLYNHISVIRDPKREFEQGIEKRYKKARIVHTHQKCIIVEGDECEELVTRRNSLYCEGCWNRHFSASQYEGDEFTNDLLETHSLYNMRIRDKVIVVQVVLIDDIDFAFYEDNEGYIVCCGYVPLIEPIYDPEEGSIGPYGIHARQDLVKPLEKEHLIILSMYKIRYNYLYHSEAIKQRCNSFMVLMENPLIIMKCTEGLDPNCIGGRCYICTHAGEEKDEAIKVDLFPERKDTYIIKDHKELDGLILKIIRDKRRQKIITCIGNYDPDLKIIPLSELEVKLCKDYGIAV